ncbi:MAG: methyltransferase domain-containing protein [Nitrospirae bacterium]|nr:MAG: methyltransferase domain-containing protein [Nitrospirota bacterium]
MSEIASIRNFDQFRDAVFAFRLPRILLSAIELDIFTVMGRTTWTVRQLANALSASERGVEILCRNLATAGLLKKQGPRYRASPLAQHVLNANSPTYRGAYLDLLRRQWEDWSHLTQAVKTGKPVDDKEPETPEYRRAFTWAMHQRSIESAREVASQLDLSGARSLLDVGGGPGTYALAFLRKNPQLHATVMDRPAALEVAKEIADSRPQRARLHLYPGDLFTTPWPQGFDVVWISNVIHIYSAAENIRLLRLAKQALNPGGRLLIQDTFLTDKEGLRPAEANLFAVTMLLFTETGNTYHVREVLAWLKTVGCTSQRLIKLKPGTGDWEGVIVEGSAGKRRGTSREPRPEKARSSR